MRVTEMNRLIYTLNKIQTVEVTDDTLSVDLSDGRTIAVPLTWYG